MMMMMMMLLDAPAREAHMPSPALLGVPDVLERVEREGGGRRHV
jgi:hypothetical protein